MNESSRMSRPAASARGKAARKALRGSVGHPVLLAFGKVNYILLGLGGIAVVAGFLLLAQREKSLSPILLVAGYCLLVPAGLLYRSRSSE